MKHVGRLLVRKGKIAGLFIPVQEGMKEGIYNVVEIMGEIQVRFVGPSAMPEPRLNGIDILGVFNERGSTMLTPDEIEKL